MLLPASVRWLTELRASDCTGLVEECAPLVGEFHQANVALEKANGDPGLHGWSSRSYMRDTVFVAMNEVRAIADKLEKLVADDLWPLPKYSEVLFIK